MPTRAGAKKALIVARPRAPGRAGQARTGRATLNPALRGPRLRLEPMRETHAAALFPVIADPALYVWIDHGPPHSVEALRQRCRRLERRRSADGSEVWLNWVLCLPGRPQPLGYVQASLLGDGRAWVAWLLEQASWGQGYALEATRLMLQHLFGALAARQAMAMVEQANSRSIALVRRLGFRRAEGEDLDGHEMTATETLWLLDAGRADDPV